MSIFGPCSPSGASDASDQEGVDLSEYAKKSHVDTQDALRVLKAGDTMSGDLDMGGQLVRGLPTTYPPLYQGDEATSWEQVVGITLGALNTAVKIDGNDPMTGDLKMGNHQIKGVTDPAEPQDAATKNYVDNRKPLITVWAEDKGPIAENEYEWSFGNGASGNEGRGYPMSAAGRVLRMGLAATTSGSAPAAASVNVVVNGVENASYGVTKPSGQYSGTSTFGTPLELAQGDRVNFRSASTNTRVTTAVVSLLIELDL